MRVVQHPRSLVGLLFLVACLLISAVAGAYAGSITNGSSADGTPGYITSGLWTAGAIDGNPADDNSACQGCHGTNGSSPTNIALNGTVLSTGTPTNFDVMFGSTTTFTLTFNIDTSDKNAGGFHVMHDDITSVSNSHGQLRKVPGDPDTHQCRGALTGSGSTTCNATLNDNTEVMHERPLTRSGNTETFQFQYIGNATTAACTTFTFGLWVNAVNQDSLCFTPQADHPDFRRFTITVNCDDGNGCTNDSCNAHSCNNFSNAVPCNDGNACTTGDTCSGGSCAPGGPTNCNDGNGCTNDSCNTFFGCQHSNNTAPCSDGNACTTGDTCAGGGCAPGGPTNCNDGNVCTNDSCVPASGCAHANNAAPCTDGNACTTGDTCSGGSCGPGGPTNCNDGNVCTNDSCIPASGCAHTNNTAPCTDNDACTVGDTCASGGCVPGPGPNCNDNNVCTNDSCDVVLGCTHANNTTPCTDGNACTTGDTCAGGACASGAPLVCNDGETCTTDSCNTSTGCVFTPVADNTPCAADANVCTFDVCKTGQCHTPVPAGVTVCRAASCAGVLPSAQATAQEFCNGTVTCPGPNVSGCGATTPCNAAATACQGGCGQDTDCPGGFFCNAANACAPVLGQGGQCTRDSMCGAGRPCVDGRCCGSACGGNNPNDCLQCSAAGVCQNLNAVACSDGNACTANDSCNAGTCVSGAAPNCNDNNVCTDDACNTGTGCTHTNNTAACNDNNACTTTDRCATGACVGGPPPVCNDGNPCTVDACDNVLGCVAPPGNGGAPCRALNGICDVAEACDGTHANCPADGFATGTPCSPGSCSGGTYTAPGVCNGAVRICPAVTPVSCAPFLCGPSGVCLSTCGADADCSAGNYCNAAKQCASKGVPGTVCTATNQCLSGFCADGFCCNAACTGACEACSLAGKAGTCSPVTGTPVPPRAVCPGDHSGCDGVCNGVTTAACTMPGGAAQCRAPSCANDTATLAGVCDGSGSCPAIQTQACAPKVCGTIRCQGCSTNAQCPTGDFCRAGVCSPLADTSSQCSDRAECKSGHCVDGVCCNSDCTGQCEACNAANQVGQCVPVTGDPKGTRSPCKGVPNECGGACDGKNARACAYPGPGQVCHPGSCTNGQALLTTFCDGAGTCPTQPQQACSGACDGPVCSGGCATNTDCNSGEYCSAGVCLTQKDNGGACNLPGECSSSYCVDGHCCSVPCLGQCEACDATGTEGTCTPITGAPHGSRQACAAGDPNCAGTCDGQKNDACTYAGALKTCRPAACALGVATVAATCQGNGSCAPPAQQDCDVFGCTTSGTAECAGDCATSGTCPSGKYCSAGICAPTVSDGMACGDDQQCTNGHCVDGLCCDTACTGLCQSCGSAGSLGRCVTITGAPRPGRPACPGSGACGGFCDGSSGIACTMPGKATSCGVAFCATGVANNAASCNGVGLCTADPQTVQCAPYQCDAQGGGCLAGCGGNEDCAPPAICTNGSCVVVAVPDGGTQPDAAVGTGGADAGTPGAGGTGGSAGAGGTAGAAGATTGRDAGTPGTGGRSAVDGGRAATGGALTNRDAGNVINGSDRGSCGCRVPGTGSGGGEREGSMVLLGLIATAWMRRRVQAERRVRT